MLVSISVTFYSIHSSLSKDVWDFIVGIFKHC